MSVQRAVREVPSLLVQTTDAMLPCCSLEPDGQGGPPTLKTGKKSQDQQKDVGCKYAKISRFHV